MKKVNATAGSIGYAALPDAKANNKGQRRSSWRCRTTARRRAAKPTSPQPNTGTVANCAAITYKVPKISTGLDIDWSQVFGAKPAVGGRNYPLCTLTYGLVFHGYRPRASAKAQEITVRDYLYGYVVQSAGQSAINSNYYAPVPSTGNPLISDAPRRQSISYSGRSVTIAY